MHGDKEAFLKIAKIELYSYELFNDKVNLFDDKVHWYHPIAKRRARKDEKRRQKS
jgi:hypothetical protein